MAVTVLLTDVDVEAPNAEPIQLVGFPFPGDVIERKDGSKVRVLRRVFIEQVRNETVTAAQFYVRKESED